MSSSFHIKRNDTGPPIAAVMEVDDEPVDIQGAAVRFHMRHANNSTVVVDAAANNDQSGDGSDGSKGHVSYDWDAADTETAGRFRAEWEVTFADGTIRTFPNPGYTTVVITGDLA